MPLDLNTTIAGSSIGGLTNPTFTLQSDTGPTMYARQSIVTAIGGTAVGVTTHSPSSPFSITHTKPSSPARPPQVTNNGLKVGKAGRNKYTLLVRKGTTTVVNTPPEISSIRVECDIASGAEIHDAPNLAALYSSTIALLEREKANLLVTAKTGGH